MAFEPIVLNNEETKTDLSIVEVALHYGDLLGGEVKFELFDAYLLFDGYYMVFIDDEAVIATLQPSRQIPGKFELDREILSLQNCAEVERLISFAEQMTAADLIRLVDLYGVND
ncbi:hypothetical protein ABET36_05730 [Caldifermentibacillus hisashii]|uniref:hypothetical protein n=1 Tax=Caldifermentibacillus hisashii TaxID=996558 RepID=UPI003D2215CA